MLGQAPVLQFAETVSFEWDEIKNHKNLAKHGLDFDDASAIFSAPVLVWKSPYKEEERWIAVGQVFNRIISVIFTCRGEAIRIISARHPRANEKRAYRNAQMGRAPDG